MKGKDGKDRSGVIKELKRKKAMRVMEVED